MVFFVFIYYHVYALNTTQRLVNYNFCNIYKYLSNTTFGEKQLFVTSINIYQFYNTQSYWSYKEKITKPGYNGHLSLVVSFGSVPWVTTIDRLDCNVKNIYIAILKINDG